MNRNGNNPLRFHNDLTWVGFTVPENNTVLMFTRHFTFYFQYHSVYRDIYKLMWIHVTERWRIAYMYRRETHLGTSGLQTNSVVMLLSLEAYLGTSRSGLMRAWNMQSFPLERSRSANSTILLFTWKKNSSLNIKDK